MDRDVLMHQMTERFQGLYDEALDALDRTPDGQWIAASEWAFRDAFLQLMKEGYQAAMQSKADAHPSRRAGMERWEMVEYPAALAKGWDPGAPGLRPDGGHVQEPHSAAQTSGDEMGHG